LEFRVSDEELDYGAETVSDGLGRG